jgi:phosphate:Na+ symporter
MDILTVIGYLLNLTGALVLFLFGMKIMSEAMQKVAGNRLRYFLQTITYKNNRAVLTGFIITALIQSSSAFTVTTVGLVNAGLISLGQSLGLIIGANIGTTVTAWLVTFFGFSFKIETLLLPMLAAAFPLLFSKKPNVRYSGEIVFGFVIIFLGLGFLKDIIPDLSNNTMLITFIKEYGSGSSCSILLFVLTGMVLTTIFQSSSAMFTFTLVLAVNGLIGIDAAAAMILGENIGTTTTANISAIVANSDGKRAALFHFAFNVTGTVWALVLFHPFINAIHEITTNIPLPQSMRLPVQLSAFHSLFNIINGILFIGFVDKIEALLKKLIRKTENREDELTQILPGNIMPAPELSLFQVRKELSESAVKVKNMFEALPQLLLEKRDEVFKNVFKTLKHYEYIIDKNETSLYSFLGKITENELSNESARMVRGFVVSIDNIETIGDICYKMARLIKEKNKEKVWFIQKQRDDLSEMFKLVDKSLMLMIKNINLNGTQINEKEVVKTEQKINKKRDKLLMNLHLYKVKNNLPLESQQYFMKFIEMSEKIGDHAINVSEALAGHKFS